MDTSKGLFAKYKAELCLPQNWFLIFGEGLGRVEESLFDVEVDKGNA
jgi:hypothetical protein